MDWNEFVQRLTRELVRLPDNAFLIVHTPGGFPYAQAMRYANGLVGEVVANEFLPDHLRLAPVQEKKLAGLGWEPPGLHGHVNWWRFVPLPAEITDARPEELAEVERLAHQMAAALGEIYGVPEPEDLLYRANQNGPDGGPLSMPALGLVPAEHSRGQLRQPFLGWEEFTERLACELAALDPRMVLVVHQRLQGSYYTQALCRPDGGIHAEAVSSEVLPEELRLDPVIEDRMIGVGWLPPGTETTEGRVHPNWTYDLPAGGTATAYRRLAAMMVTALRDVQGAREPADLAYEAFSGTAFIQLMDFGIDPADPRRVNERRPQRPLPEDPEPAPGPAVIEMPPAMSAYQDRPDPAAEAELEARLLDARARADHQAYLSLLLESPLFLPLPGPDEPTAFATVTFTDGTYILAFTSPTAMEEALRGQAGQHRRTSIVELARTWPRAEWQLAVNAGLASAAYIDSGTIHRLAGAPDPRAVAAPAPPPAPLADTTVPLAAEAPLSPIAAESAMAPVAPMTPAAPAAPAAATGSAAPAAPSPPAVPSRPLEEPVVAATGLPDPGEPAVASVPSASAEPAAAVPTAPLAAPAAPSAAAAPAASMAGSGPAAAQAPSAAPQRTPGTAVMQKIVSHEHVEHYLDGGYDRVAGYVYRASDLAGLTTPGALVRALGLTYEGSSFSVHDEAIHVIRWPAVKGSLFRIPYGGVDEVERSARPDGWVIERPPFLGTGYAPGDGSGAPIPELKIDSQRLPHGTEMYRIDRTGAETFVAVFDADHQTWIRRA